MIARKKGHVKQQLGRTIPASKLRKGMEVFYSGAMCVVERVLNPAHPDFPDLILLNLGQHPHRQSFTTCAKQDDIFHREVVSEEVVSEDAREGWHIEPKSQLASGKRTIEPSKFNPLGRKSEPKAKDTEVPATRNQGRSISSSREAAPRAASHEKPVAGEGDLELRIPDGLWDVLDKLSGTSLWESDLHGKPSLGSVWEKARHQGWWFIVLSKRQAFRLYSVIGRLAAADVLKNRALPRVQQDLSDKFSFGQFEKLSDEELAEAEGCLTGKPPRKRKPVEDDTDDYEVADTDDIVAFFESFEPASDDEVSDLFFDEPKPRARRRFRGRKSS